MYIKNKNNIDSLYAVQRQHIFVIEFVLFFVKKAVVFQ